MVGTGSGSAPLSLPSPKHSVCKIRCYLLWFADQEAKTQKSFHHWVQVTKKANGRARVELRSTCLSF